MHDLIAQRTLVKSPPELWDELSELERLARHLGAFGEIKITKLDPEHTVAWEGEAASGTVSIEPSGWGTKVTLSARLEETAPAETPAANAPVEEPVAAEREIEEPSIEEAGAAAVEAERPVEAEQLVEPAPPEEPAPPQRRGFFARLFRRRAAPPAVTPHAADAEEHGIQEAVAEAPVAEEAPAVEEKQAMEERPAVEAPVAEERAVEGAALDAPPVPVSPVADEPVGSASLDRAHAQAVLDEVLDALGTAHHRPFSRG
jgi:hypothetical protein